MYRMQALDSNGLLTAPTMFISDEIHCTCFHLWPCQCLRKLEEEWRRHHFPVPSQCFTCMVAMRTPSSAGPWLWLTLLLPNLSLNNKSLSTSCQNALATAVGCLQPACTIFSRGIHLYLPLALTGSWVINCCCPASPRGTVAALCWHSASGEIIFSSSDYRHERVGKGMTGLLANSGPKKWWLLTMQKAFPNSISRWTGIVLAVYVLEPQYSAVGWPMCVAFYCPPPLLSAQDYWWERLVSFSVRWLVFLLLYAQYLEEAVRPSVWCCCHPHLLLEQKGQVFKCLCPCFWSLPGPLSPTGTLSGGVEQQLAWVILSMHFLVYFAILHLLHRLVSCASYSLGVGEAVLSQLQLTPGRNPRNVMHWCVECWTLGPV